MSDDQARQPSHEMHNADAADAADFQAVLSTPQGQRVFDWLLGICGVYGAVFAGEDHAATDFNLGARNVGLRVITQLDQVDPTLYPRMLLEKARLRAVMKEEPARVETVDPDDVVGADAAP